MITQNLIHKNSGLLLGKGRYFVSMKAKSILGIIIFLGYPLLLKLIPFDLVTMEVTMWILLLFILFWIYFVEKETITSIGWKKPTLKTILAGMGLGVLLFVAFGLSNVAIHAMGFELNQDVAKIYADQPFGFLLLVALRAGVVEEVLYRGYAFERILTITKSKWLAIFIPLVMFMLAHVSWGIGHLLFVFIAGGLVALIYLLRRNLFMVIIAHFTVDVIALTVLPLLLKA